MILGETTAMRAFKSVEGMDRLGPAYLMARERAAEKQNTLRMGLMLVFMDVLVGGKIRFWEGRSFFPSAVWMRHLSILEYRVPQNNLAVLGTILEWKVKKQS